MYISQLEIEQYMSENNKYFEASEVNRFKNIIAKSRLTLNELNSFKFKNPQTAVILSVCLGMFGVDRFYAGNYIIGILKLCSFGFWGIGWIVDWFLIGKAVKVKNQSDFYGFLNGQAPKSSINTDTIKRTVQSKEFRDALKGLKEAGKGLSDTMDIDNHY